MLEVGLGLQQAQVYHKRHNRVGESGFGNLEKFGLDHPGPDTMLL